MSDSKINTEEVEAKNWSVGNVTDDWIDINGWRHILLRNGKEFCFRMWLKTIARQQVSVFPQTIISVSKTWEPKII